MGSTESTTPYPKSDELFCAISTFRKMPAGSDDLRKPESERLREMGIVVVPIDYPPQTDPSSVLNYKEIVHAFYNVLHPRLFHTLGVDPYPRDRFPYYDDLFKSISDPFPVYVEHTGPSSIGCLGQTGQTDGNAIYVVDCALSDVVMHEIGHVIHRRGILGGVEPLYYPGYSVPDLPEGIGTNVPSRPNATELFNEVFADFSETRNDVDGIKVGFTSSRSTVNDGENFAEHFASYVFHGESFRRIAERQEQDFGSHLLRRKYRYISNIYFRLHFDDRGNPVEWSGIRI